MASIVVSGDTSGAITLQAPAVAGTTTLTLPTTSGTVLTSASSVAASQLPVGSILQVVQGSVSGTAGTPYFSTTSNAFTNTGLSATITPTSSSSRILVLVSANIWIVRVGTVDAGCGIGLRRNSTSILESSFAGIYLYAAGATTQTLGSYSALNYLDSPATTSATTYHFTMSAYTNNGGTQAILNYNFSSPTTSTITLIEVKA